MGTAEGPWGIVTSGRATYAREWEGMMDEPSLEALSQRVKRLEQASLRWKRLASSVLVLLGIAMLLGATASKKVKRGM
jgi:hypothetical protein